MKTPDVKGYGEAQVEDRHENRSPELLEKNPDEAGLQKNVSFLT
jgi:hypothetical protein